MRSEIAEMQKAQQELARHFEKSPPGHGPQSTSHLGNREALRLGKKEEDNLSLTKVKFL